MVCFFTQPDYNTARETEDPSHRSDLLSLLFLVTLVDTYRIHPKNPLEERVAQLKQRCMQVFRYINIDKPFCGIDSNSFRVLG